MYCDGDLRVDPGVHFRDRAVKVCTMPRKNLSETSSPRGFVAHLTEFSNA
jgi:hypothetical protein